MNEKEKRELAATLELLRNEGSLLQPKSAEKELLKVLEPLLVEDGYQIDSTSLSRHRGMDLVAHRPGSAQKKEHKLGVDFCFHRTDKSVSISKVEMMLNMALLDQVDRVILLSNARFSKEARDSLRREMPLEVELMDLDSLSAWVDRLSAKPEKQSSIVKLMISNLSSKLALLIAENPRYLDEIEWRDIERIVAEVFEGLGFSATLTPPSKDGGKDVVLECIAKGERAEYIVEIKHWRSGVRVGGEALKSFLNVVVRESRQGGLFLSTYGFCDNAFEQLSEIERKRIRFGSEEKIVSLCRTYEKATSGLWSPPDNLADVLYEYTL